MDLPEINFTPFSASAGRKTAFGQYDGDAQFQRDADSVVYWVMRHLGAGVMDVELDIRQIWTNFEQATMEWSWFANTAHSKNTLLDLLGQPTGSLSGSEQIYPQSNFVDFARKMTIQYNNEAGTAGNVPWLSASITTTPGQQVYDLFSAVSSSLSGTVGKSIVIRDIFHYEPIAYYSFFDVSGLSGYGFFNLEGSSTGYATEAGAMYRVYPVWEDIATRKHIETTRKVRSSNYSFDLKAYNLYLYPTPSDNRKVFFQYTINPTDNLNGPLSGTFANGSRGVTSGLSNLAFGHIGYGDINSIGKKWIWDMTLALCMETLGWIYQKYSNIPIPGNQIQLDGGELIARSNEMKQNLRQELRELFDALKYSTLVAEKDQMEEQLIRVWKRVPMGIYRR